MGTRQKIDVDMAEVARLAVTPGVTVRDAAAMFGVSFSTMRSRLSEHNITWQKTPSAPSKREQINMNLLLRFGLDRRVSQNEAAARLGVTRPTVAKYWAELAAVHELGPWRRAGSTPPGDPIA